MLGLRKDTVTRFWENCFSKPLAELQLEIADRSSEDDKLHCNRISKKTKGTIITPESTTADGNKGVLATDLDGTLIPLQGNRQNQVDLDRVGVAIRERALELVFVTGRHLNSVRSAIVEFNLPTPDWLICDVGTSLFRVSAQDAFVPVNLYTECLQSILGSSDIQPLATHLQHVPGLRLQEIEKQGRYKLSYYCEAQHVAKSCDAIRNALDSRDVAFELIASVDPFVGGGLINVLPKGVSKAFALNWWASFRQTARESIFFAGDSGNDLAAMTAGYKTIVVGNADRGLVEQVAQHHREQAWRGRLFRANAEATSGVLEGLRHFGAT